MKHCIGPLALLVIHSTATAQSPGIAWEHISTELTESAGTHLCVLGDTDMYVLSSSAYSGERRLERFNGPTGERLWTIAVDSVATNFGIAAIGNDGILIGGTNGIGHGLARFNTSGQLVWSDQVDLGDTWGLGGITSDQAQNSYIAWSTWNAGAQLHHTFVSKYSPNGTHEWDYEYNTAWPDDNWPNKILVDQEGNILVGGWREPTTGNDPENGFLLKLDPTGEHVWDVEYPTDDNDERTLDMAIVEDGAVLMCISRPDDYVDGGSVVKFASDGSLEWGYDAPDFRHPFKIVLTPGSMAYYVLEREDDYLNRLLRFAPDGTPLLDVTINAPLIHSAIPIEGELILISRVVPDTYSDGYFTALDTLGAVVWELAHPGVCTYYCDEESAFPMAAGPPGHIYSTGSHHINSMQFAATLDIALPCVPSGTYCLDSTYTDTLSLNSNAWVADLNGDGLADMLTTRYNQQDLMIHYNEGGTFAPGQPIPLPYSTGTIRTADLDNDGDPDIMVAEQQGDHVMSVTNNGNNFSYAGALQAGAEILQFEVGDADGTNGVDLFIRYTANVPDHIHIYPNNGTGVFGSSPYVLLVPSFASSMAIGDLDHDGPDDVALLGDGGAYGTVRFSTGNGTYGSGVDIAYYSAGATIIMVDIDDDGWLDVLSMGTGAVSVNRNQQGAGFDDDVWVVPGSVAEGVPHPFPGDDSTRYFLPDASQSTVGLHTWDECAGDFAFAGLGSTQSAALFARDITGDAGVELLALEPNTGQLHIWRHCDHSEVPIGMTGQTIRSSDLVQAIPNPSNGTCRITWSRHKDFHVEILDASGRRMSVIGSVRGEALFDTRDWPAGLYTARLRSEHGIATTNIAVVH